MARCDPLSGSSRSSVLQPSQYTYLDKTIRDMLALKCFTIACIFTSFLSHYYSNAEVDLLHSRPPTRLSLVHTIPTITYSTIILVHHLRCSLTGIVEATIPAMHSAHRTQEWNVHWPPRSPLHFYLMHLGSTTATGLPFMYFSWLPVLLFQWTLSAFRFYCIMSVSSRRRYIELFTTDSVVTVCVICVDLLSRRRYQWIVCLVLPARSARHIGGYRHLDDTFPVFALCMDCS